MKLQLLFAAAIAALGIALIAIIRLQRHALQELRKAREDLDHEERRMFEFLHGLGEALANDETANRMYEIIVNGIANVMEAQGAALYLYDTTRKLLVPARVTRGCPPFIPLPKEVASSSKKQSAGSYLRRTAVKPGFGLVGKVFEERTPLYIPDLGEEPAYSGSDNSKHLGISALAQPLLHGEKRLGVLVAVNRAERGGFDSHDFDLFRSAAEQSAFALGNALIHQEAADKKRIEDELYAASEIQRILLPSDSPEIPAYRLFAENYPAKIVSGDYYDFIDVDDTHLGVVIADVSGKGIPASLIMAMCRSVLRSNAPGNLSPSAVLAQVNRLIFPDIREDMFISMAYLILEKNGPNITMSRAGHDAPLCYHKTSGEITSIDSPGMAVGIDAGSVFERITKDKIFQIKQGDTLLLVTDGTHEALDADGDEFGMERLQDAFAISAGHGADAVVSAVMTSIREFVGDPRQSDDITLIAIEKR